jgi:hypothetical protein
MAGHMQWFTPVLTVLAGLFGGYFGAYMAKKGENKAIHEDIEKLVDQVRAVTRTTEEIKASISTEAWKRDLKKEACYELIKQLQPIGASLSKLMASHSKDTPELVQQAQVEFVTAYGYYLNAEIVVEMVGSKQLQQARQELTKTIMRAHRQIEARALDDGSRALAQFANANADLMNACRRELGFEDEIDHSPANG